MRLHYSSVNINHLFHRPKVSFLLFYVIKVPFESLSVPIFIYYHHLHILPSQYQYLFVYPSHNLSFHDILLMDINLLTRTTYTGEEKEKILEWLDLFVWERWVRVWFHLLITYLCADIMSVESLVIQAFSTSRAPVHKITSNKMHINLKSLIRTKYLDTSQTIITNYISISLLFITLT